jgi:hypothetical protein
MTDQFITGTTLDYARSTFATLLYAEIFEVLQRHNAKPEVAVAVALAIATDMAGGPSSLACEPEFAVAVFALENLASAFAQRGLWREFADVTQLQLGLAPLQPIL